LIARDTESWQSVAAVFQAKADLQNFALELSKKMSIRYVSPPKPIDLTVKGGLSNLVNPSEAGGPDARGGDARRRGSLDALSDTSTIGHAAEDVAAMFDTELPPPRFEGQKRSVGAAAFETDDKSARDGREPKKSDVHIRIPH
jgi:hypothetical protein